MAGEGIKNLSEAEFNEFITNATSPVLVDFWAAWCGPCRMIAPVIEEIAADNKDKVTVAKVNVDENQGVAAGLSISSIPTLIIFKNGREVERIIGYRTKKELQEILDKHI